MQTGMCHYAGMMACSLGRVQEILTLLGEAEASAVATDAFTPRRRYAALCQGKIRFVSTAYTGSLDGYLNLCEVVCCVLLVPRAIEVAEAGVAAELHSLLFDIGQGFGHRL